MIWSAAWQNRRVLIDALNGWIYLYRTICRLYRFFLQQYLNVFYAQHTETKRPLLHLSVPSSTRSKILTHCLHSLLDNSCSKHGHQFRLKHWIHLYVWVLKLQNYFTVLKHHVKYNYISGWPVLCRITAGDIGPYICIYINIYKILCMMYKKHWFQISSD